METMSVDEYRKLVGTTDDIPDQMSAQEYIDLTEGFSVDGKKKKKFNNNPMEVDGVVFDSEFEAKCYWRYKSMEEQGLITDFKLQPCFELQPKFVRNGKRILSITYTADFEFTRISDGQRVVVEAKGAETREWKRNKKFFLYKFPEIEFHIVFERKESEIWKSE